MGQLAVHHQLIHAGGGWPHPGGVVVELVDGYAVAVEHLEGALPAIGVGGDLQHPPAQAGGPYACTFRATAANSSSWLGGRVADRNDATDSLATSIGPPGSASEIATPATSGARRIRVHSWSVKSCSDVMATS